MIKFESFFLINLKAALITILVLAVSSVYGVIPAPTDLCTAPPALTASSTCTPENFTVPSAWGSSISTSCASQDKQDGWYLFVGTGEIINIVTTSAASRHVLAVFTGTCGSFTLVQCQQAIAGASTNINFSSVVGTNYYIQLHRTASGAAANLVGTICIKNLTISKPGGVSNGLGSWYSADGNLTLSGSTVTYWKNNIPTFPDITSYTNTPSLIANSTNFNPAIQFDGTDKMNGVANGATFTGTNLNTVLMVANYHSGAVIAKWEQDLFPDNRISMEGMSGNQIRYDHPTQTSYMTSTSGVQDKWTLSTGLGSSTTDDLYINGLWEASDAGGTNNPSGNGHIMFGDNYTGGSYPATFDITEIIYYSTTLNATDRNKVESYLSTKYGLTLGNNASPVNYTASTGLVYWTGSTTYQNDIAGIGRDDNGNLNQKKSLSMNSDGMVTMALTDLGGTFATPNSFDNNLEYMVWGNDNGSLIESTSEVPSPFTKRLPREWKIQETGTVGTVSIQININGLTVSGTTNSLTDFALIIDEDKDGNFLTGTIRKIYPISNSGGILQFNGVDFANGEIFSLATDVDTTLPIEFISLNVEANLSHNIINWVTGATDKSHSFVVTRSTDGTKWEKLGEIVIDQNSGKHFSFIDVNNLQNSVYYYRIIEISKEGEYTYSKIVSTSQKEINSIEFNIYPNPAKQSLYIYLNRIPSLSEPLVAAIYSMDGKVVLTSYLANQENLVNLNGLSPGMYIIEVRDQNFMPERKIFIVE